jgi:hypothetical protein
VTKLKSKLVQTLPQKKPLFGSRTPTENVEGGPQTEAKAEIPSLRQVITARVRRALLNYAFLAFTSMAIAGVLPLFLYTPIRLGGLGFSEVQIGKALSGQAVATAVIQLVLFPIVQVRLGTVGTFRAGAIFYPLACAMFPLTSYVARQEHASSAGADRTQTWIVLSIQISMLCMANLVYSCNMLIINAAAPSQHALGTLNGVAQMMASLVRSVALAGAPSLFALSINKHLLGGQAIWIFMTLCGLGLVCTSWTIKDAKASWRDEPKPPEEE